MNSFPKTKALQELLTILGGVVLLFASSQIDIPLKPVPITLHTVAVMLIGLTYSPKLAAQSLLLWLGLGAIGAPMFSGFHGGLPYMCGPTGGYLVGFLVSATLMAYLKEKLALNSVLSNTALCLVGTILVYSLGVLWLSSLIGFESALIHGVYPFILPGIIKIALLCTALKSIRLVRNR